jgi:hypothetical protein
MNKIKQAEEILIKCIKTNGICASTVRYDNQCWTRDLCIAIIPYVVQTTNPVIPLSNVLVHIENIQKRQKANGQVPIVFLNDVDMFVKEKTEKELRTGQKSFMLKRHKLGELENLTPHTRDGELLYILAVHSLCQRFPDEIESSTVTRLLKSARLALEYVENNILNSDTGLIMGADWRDTREDLDQSCVLTNACLLKQVYAVTEQRDKEVKVMSEINKLWNGKYFDDYKGCSNFDVFGNSLAVLYGISNQGQTESIFQFASTLTTPYGIKMTEVFLPALSDKEQKMMEKDKAVVWPFVSGYMLYAMACLGGSKWVDFAQQEFLKWASLHGFYEWYSISNGEGFGSEGQAWSAAQFLRLHHLFETMSL